MKCKPPALLIVIIVGTLILGCVPATPSAPPTPTPVMQASLSDFAGAFSRLDDGVKAPEEYEALLLKLADCLVDETKNEVKFSDYSDGEMAAVKWTSIALALGLIMAETSGEFGEGQGYFSLNLLASQCIEQ